MIPDSLKHASHQFLESIAAYSFYCWLSRGAGSVLINEPKEGMEAKEVVHKFIDYLPAQEVPEDAKSLTKTYNPSKEIVLTIKSIEGNTTSFTLTATDLGISPIESCRKLSIHEGKGRFVPGEVLFLRVPIDELQNGFYVFLGRVGAMMELCEAGIEDDEDIAITDATHRIHLDFEESFRVLDGVVLGGMLTE
jgi:hypothetical protein